MGFVNRYEDRQTIDEDRGAVLVSEGGTPIGWDKFCLQWQGEEIRFYAYPHLTKENDNKESVHWVFFNIKIPKSLDDKEEEISQMIQEALVAYGMRHSHKYLKGVSAEPGRPPPESRCA